MNLDAKMSQFDDFYVNKQAVCNQNRKLIKMSTFLLLFFFFARRVLTTKGEINENNNSQDTDTGCLP